MIMKATLSGPLALAIIAGATGPADCIADRSLNAKQDAWTCVAVHTAATRYKFPRE
jgi:hypothetical protein